MPAPDGRNRVAAGDGPGDLTGTTNTTNGCHYRWVSLSARDALAILAVAAASDADPRVVGGWGIDALAGQQTRDHVDLDLMVRADRLAAVVEALMAAGFTVEGDPAPSRLTLVDDEGRRVDLYALRQREDGSAWHSGLRGVRHEFPAGCWAGGQIGGQSVTCLGAAMQRRVHFFGQDLDDTDRHDLAVLDGLSRP